MTLSPRRGLAWTPQGLRWRPVPDSLGPHDVDIEVALAGLCRTDQHVATGAIPVADGRILGHELAGRVRAVGPAVRRLRPSDRVTLNPYVGCGACPECDASRPHRCPQTRMLGIGRDGGFATHVVVPERAVHRLPEGLSWRLGAYAEPVAASLSVRQARLEPGARGAVLGRGRIAELTRRVLAVDGVHAPIRDPDQPLPARALDFVVETRADGPTLARALDALAPGGLLVLKSRPAAPVPFDVHAAVTREITVRAVAYGSFDDALVLLASGRLAVDDLLGETFPLEDYAAAFSAAERSEAEKLFLRPGSVD